jgi:N-methylhydantoinase A
MSPLLLGIDIGGTFTDLIMMHGDGHVAVVKTPSTPGNPRLAVERGISLLAERLGLTITDLTADCSLVVHGTTVATNTLLERRGARTALLTTAGFRDLLEMREGTKMTGRYNLLSLPPTPLVPRYLRLPVIERIRYDGGVKTALDLDSLAQSLDRLAEERVEAAAVCFLHSTANPAHEHLAGKALAERFPRLFVCLSHQVLPQVSEYDRLSTTVVNAYVGLVLANYLRGLTKSLHRAGYRRDILVMQSHGGVLPAAAASKLAAGAILSGPAGGVYGSAFYGSLLGLQDLVSLDMGGTSTDIALIQHGKPAMIHQQEIDAVRVALPSLAVHTLGAGGGSIASVGLDGLLQVGPLSAGAEPGPACYGRGGNRPTVTDANLLLGYLDPDTFLDGTMPLDQDKAMAAMTDQVAQPLGQDAMEAAYGVHRLVNVQMAEGIRAITIREGHDPHRFALLAGGGAAGLHAVALARELAMARVIVPRLAPVLSTLGLLATDVRHELSRPCVGKLEMMASEKVQRLMDELADSGRNRLGEAGIPELERALRFSVDLLYGNQVHTLNVPLEQGDLLPGNWPSRLRARFETVYRRRYGYYQPDQSMHARTIRLAAIGRLPNPQLAQSRAGLVRPAKPIGERLTYLGAWVPTAVYRFEQLAPGETLSGPAVVDGDYTTVLLPPECHAEVDPWGGLIIHVS